MAFRTSAGTRANPVAAALAVFFLASLGHCMTSAVGFTEDAVCVVQSALARGGRLTPDDEETEDGEDEGQEGSPEVAKAKLVASAHSQDPAYCVDKVQMDMNRMLLKNNLGGLADPGEDPVIHISPFVDLVDGRMADLIVSNLSEYSANNFHLNGLKGEFNNVNIKAGHVDLLFTFVDSATKLPLEMPPFNLTIYDLDGPLSDTYAERVSIGTAEIDYYELTTSTTVIATETGNMTDFGSSAWGLLCDNPTSIETVGWVKCKTGLLNQKDRGVAVQMKGGKSSYHISLWASSVAQIGRNFLFGLPAYFEEVCHAPTESPTPAPTPPPTNFPTPLPTPPPTKSPTAGRTRYTPPTSTAAFTQPPDSATSFGDPHVTNLKGERFDILNTGNHTFLVIPRGADEEGALLRVVARVDPLGSLCTGLLYVTDLRFSGRWVGDLGSLEFTTRVDAAMEAEKAMKIKAGASTYLNTSQFKESVPHSLAELTVLQPQEPQALNQHVDLLLVKLKLGPSIAKVRLVYQKEKVGFSTSLWLTTSGLGHVHEEIGGVLGYDDHRLAASKPKKCEEPGTFLPGLPNLHGSVHASASFEDLDE